VSVIVLRAEEGKRTDVANASEKAVARDEWKQDDAERKADQQAQKRGEREVPWMCWAERMVRWLEKCSVAQQHAAVAVACEAVRADAGDAP
jgi:hypothetical protein